MDTLRLIGTFARVAVMNEVQYRVNFFLQLLQSLIALGTGLVALSLVFSYTTDLAGWTRPELLLVMGVHVLTGGLIRATIQPNMERLMGDIGEGTLDYALTKPEDSQFLVSIREFRLWQLIDVCLGLGLAGIALWQLRSAISGPQALAFAVALFLGGIMIYSVWLMLTTGAFWFIRVENIMEVFQSLYQAGRWPVGVYPGWLRFGLTFLVPVAFAVTVPSEALTGRLTAPTLMGAAAMAVVLFVLARRVWWFGLTRYSGASA
jgi:ABC-2 type transport system permease protein